jgi:predicted Co/Zn/Cd cation transporter (cation efflux family)
MEEITRYYREIEDIIEIQKYTTYNAVLGQRSAIEAELRMLRESLENEVEELAGIGNDIQNNMEAV